MIGYHYTNAKFRDSILKQGLQSSVIYDIDRLPAGTKGVWIFNSRLEGDQEKAFVLRQIVKFDCSQVDLYEVEYSLADMPLGGFDKVSGEHTTTIEGRHYRNICTVLAGPIPTDRIRFMGTFSLDFKAV